MADGGDGLCFEVRDRGAAAPAFAVRFKGQVYAYLNRCAHLPMELDWKPGKFFDAGGSFLICSTHGAAYSPDDGKCVWGPCAGGKLVSVPVEERDGKIFLKADSYGGK